jgi:hypothetical protein
VYYQSGNIREPQTVRREVSTGIEVRVPGDLEGIPPSGEPGISCGHGLLYAAGYGDDQWKPWLAPVPFEERDRHGISEMRFDPPSSRLFLSTQEILDWHPDRARILRAEEERKARLGADEFLTLMTYCVRWNRQGTRMLVFFGNHCVVKERGEPKICSVLTADRNLQNLQLALDFSFDRRGSHWSWQPDGDHLIGYGPRTDGHPGVCLAEVRYDGSGYRMLAEHLTGHGARHPSASPANPDLLVTDEITVTGGAVVFISRTSGAEIGRCELPKFHGDHEPSGRNPRRVCHHPVWNHAGDKVLCNSLPGKYAELVEISIPEAFPEYAASSPTSRDRT